MDISVVATISFTVIPILATMFLFFVSFKKQ